MQGLTKAQKTTLIALLAILWFLWTIAVSVNFVPIAGPIAATALFVAMSAVGTALIVVGLQKIAKRKHSLL